MDIVVSENADEDVVAPVRTVPCSSGGRLHISWGVGHFLRIVDCVPSATSSATANVNGSTSTSLKWFVIAYTLLAIYISPAYCLAAVS